MSSLEQELKAAELIQEANALRDSVLERYGAFDFDELPEEGQRDFDALMALAGWTTHMVTGGEADD